MRCARKVSESGFYHVVTKGEADQPLFCDDADREFYIHALDSACKEFKLRLHAYCLMSNHVHLLVEDPEQNLSSAMKLLNEHYAKHFKSRTQRTGHVFKNRFWSEPIEDDAYLLCAMRYIHANPAAAGICMASAYPWSSVRDYLGRDGITTTELLLSMLGGRKGFIAFSKEEPFTALPFPNSALAGHLSKDEQRRIATSVVGNLGDLRDEPRERKVAAIRALRRVGFTKMQVTKLTGLGRSLVYSVA